jgi:hypothetical protein
MLVFRVETHDGVGPYYDPDDEQPEDRWGGCGYVDARHPKAYQDGISDAQYMAFGDERRYGFVSMAQLCEWFDIEERYLLRNADFVVGVYEVHASKVLIGGRQVIFDSKYATRIRRDIMPVYSDTETTTL